MVTVFMFISLTWFQSPQVSLHALVIASAFLFACIVPYGLTSDFEVVSAKAIPGIQRNQRNLTEFASPLIGSKARNVMPEEQLRQKTFEAFPRLVNGK
jgi:hypothetical protein